MNSARGGEKYHCSIDNVMFDCNGQRYISYFNITDKFYASLWHAGTNVQIVVSYEELLHCTVLANDDSFRTRHSMQYSSLKGLSCAQVQTCGQHVASCNV